MAAKKKPINKRDTRLVTIRLFKDNGKYKDDVFVGLNGVSYQIKRGVDVQVPKAVARILENSMKQDEATALMIEHEEELAREADIKLK